jgi:hypothetical protein
MRLFDFPFKSAIFLPELSDGWGLVCQSLVGGYQGELHHVDQVGEHGHQVGEQKGEVELHEF